MTFRPIVLALLLASLPASKNIAWPSGSIHVRVEDAAGNPIANALVKANYRNGKWLMTAIPECITDKSGTCTCRHLILTRYHITASKISDGYPNTSWSLYGHRLKAVIVALTPSESSADVTVTLGPRAGHLFLRIADANTGASVFNPSIELRVAADPRIFVSQGLSKNSSVLVPADENILLEVHASGYKTWHMLARPDDAAPLPIHLASGQREELTIQMQPD
jgi:hypothetical protein